MFALALYDADRQQVLLARDRAGEKPLFYSLESAVLRFASELKALMADPSVPRRLDPEAVDCYLAFGYIPGERAILQGVRKLPPAHALAYDLHSGSARQWRYWEPPPAPGAASDAAVLTDELEGVLEAAVRRQLVADVPVGVLLSGGVDSSLITALAARAVPRVKTFTVRFPGFAAHDETGHARLIAHSFGTEHLELDAQEASVELLPILARQFDEPMADSSMVPTYLISRLVREHCTVALGGDGGDELFGGYPHYRRALQLQQRAGRLPAFVRRGLARAGVAMLPVGFRGRNWVQALGSDFDRGVPCYELVFDAHTRSALMAGHDWTPVAERVRASRVPAGRDLLDRTTRMDFENYLAEDILVKTDRAAMLSSLEVRAPFLDRPVIEFAFGKVPSALKATPARLKILLKGLCARVLPRGFDYERKQGFSIPLDAWLESGAWAARFREVLLDPGATFHRSAVLGLLEGQRRGRNNSERLFALVLFELWRHEYRVTF
jgi:asparagine synthase (glutamine-hydrolysing)